MKKKARGLLLTISTALIFLAPVTFADASGESPSLSNLPISLFGTWKVKSVLINLEWGRRVYYQSDDPQLVGDTIIITDQKIESNTPESEECLSPSAATWKTNVASLLAATLATPLITGAPPSVSAYDFPLVPNAVVEAFSIKCNPRGFGPYPLAAAKAIVGPKGVGT